MDFSFQFNKQTGILFHAIASTSIENYHQKLKLHIHIEKKNVSKEKIRQNCDLKLLKKKNNKVL